MNSKEITKEIAERGLVKYLQIIEISLFLITGFLLNYDVFYAVVALILGITAALFASKSAIKEYQIKIGEKESGTD